MRYKTIYIYLFFIAAFASCTKFVTISAPPNQTVTENVFTSDASATAAILGAYSSMMSGTGFASGGPQSVTQLAGLSADDLINYSTDPSTQEFFKNDLTAFNSIVLNNLWNEGYKYIYSANAILEGLTRATGMTDATKKQLEGEAKFIRAFYHFYLINLFGPAPMATQTDYQINKVLARSPEDVVYDQIIEDLKDAEALMSADYGFTSGERIRPTRWAATALLARVCLYRSDWANAEKESSLVISQSDLYSLNEDLNAVFIKNSTESIWQLMPVQAGFNTAEGQTFILADIPQYVSLTATLVNNFESGDGRRSKWIDSIIVNDQTYYYAFKYKVKAGEDLTEYSMVLRIAEQYLIRAEARTHLNELDDALSDINVIRHRAGLEPATVASVSSLLTAILHERQSELFTEWGHRWFDLKRTGLSDIVLGPIKSPNWQTTDTLYPIPKTEIMNDPNLTQNPGY